MIQVEPNTKAQNVNFAEGVLAKLAKLDNWRYSKVSLLESKSFSATVLQPDNSIEIDSNAMDLSKLDQYTAQNFTLSTAGQKKSNLRIAKGFEHLKLKQMNLTVNAGKHAEAGIVLPILDSGEYSGYSVDVLVKRGASLVLHDLVLSEGFSDSLQLREINFILEQDARVDMFSDLSDVSSHYCINQLSISLSDKSVFNGFQFLKGAKLLRNQAFAEHLGENSELVLNGVAYLKGGLLADTHSEIVHAKGNTISQQKFKSMVNDQSEFSFRGLIKIKENCPQVNVEQLNKNLLMSDKAVVNSRPELEVDTDDVKASHGSTTGQISPDQVFYLLSRGLSKEQATKMLKNGFCLDLLSTIENSGLRKLATKAVHRVLSDD